MSKFLPIIELSEITPNSPDLDPFISKVPEKFLPQFMQLINSLESETGKFWTLYAKNGKKNNTCEVWPYNDRNYIFTVTMNNDSHRALNGTYTSLSDIEETINDFAINDYKNTSNIEFAKVYGKYIWKCPKCEAWGGKK